MKAKKLFFGLFCLGALVLGACSGNKASSSAAPGSSQGSSGSESQPSSSSVEPPHEHQYDEHGVCPTDGAYRGDTKAATEADPYTLENLVAGTEYYVRLNVEKNVQTEFQFLPMMLSVDGEKTKVWLHEGDAWIPQESYIFTPSAQSDGYLYFKLVLTANTESASLWTKAHEHGYIDQHGFCNMCGEYAGSTMQLNTPLTVNPTVQNKWYYARITGLDPNEKYELNYELTAIDAGAYFYAWRSDDGENFYEVDILEPTGALYSSQIYLAYRPSVADYSITFLLETAHRPDDAGYCQACGEYVGEELSNALIPLMDFDAGITYYRIEATEHDLFDLVLGSELDGETYVYKRSQDGQSITEIDVEPNVPFLVPELPDGYLYLKVISFSEQLISYFGLADVGDYGFVGNQFIGRELKEGRNNIMPLNTDQVLFYKFNAYKGHMYRFDDKGGYSNTELQWYAHASDEDEFLFISMESAYYALSTTCTHNGRPIDYFILKIAPTHNHGGSEIRLYISHAFNPCGTYDDIGVCREDESFNGNVVTVNTPVNYNIEDERELYRFAVEENGEYTFQMSNGALASHFSFYYCTGSHTYAEFAWDGTATAFDTKDGYIYIQIYPSQETYAGTFLVSEV